MRGERVEEKDWRRFRGPYAHYSRPAIDGAPDEMELDVEELGLVDEPSGVRKKPVLDARSVPPPTPHHAKRRVRRPLTRDPRPIDFEEVLLLYPPVSFGGDAIVPPSPGIPIYRVLVVEAADRESSITRVVAQAIESLGEFGLELVWNARRSAATMFRKSQKQPPERPGEILAPVEIAVVATEKRSPAKKSPPPRKAPKMLAKRSPARRALPQKASVKAVSSAKGKGAKRRAPAKRKPAAAAPAVVLRKETPKRAAVGLAIRAVAVMRRWVRAAMQRVRSSWSWLGRATRALWRQPRSA